MRAHGILTLALGALLAAGAQAKPLRLVTSTADLAAIAAAVGGDAVEVESIAKGYQDPHHVQAKPSYMRRLNRADLLIYNGLELETGWLPLLIQGSRNPSVLPGTRGALDASAGVTIREVPTGQVDRSMGDIHPEGNPHYTLDPYNGMIIAGIVAERLQELAPEQAEYIAGRLAAFRSEMKTGISSWEERMAPYRDAPIVTNHKQWEYLAAWLGLDIVGYVEQRPGIPPAPRHVARLIDLIRDQRVQVVIYANFTDPRPAENVASRADVPAVVLSAAVGGDEAITTYPELFEALVTRLEDVLQPLEGNRE